MSDLQKLNQAFEAMKAHNETMLAEVRKNGEASALAKDQMEKIQNEIDAVSKEVRAIGARGSMAVAPEKAENEQRNNAFVSYLRRGVENMPSEQRGLLGQSDETGGFLVPTDFSNQVLMAAFNAAEIRPVANVGTTGRDTVTTPSLAKPVVAWGTTGVAVSDQQIAAGRERIPVNFVQALALIDNDTLDDADANIWAQLNAAFSDALSEAEDTAFATGSGVGQPQGVMTNAAVLARYVASGVAAALTDNNNNGVDKLIQAVYSVKKTYRRNGVFAMNSATERVVRQIKDSNGQYLWQPPVAAGAPATLLGYRVINPEGMADIAANSYPIVFGDFGRYWIRDRGGVSVQRLNERYAEYNQTGFKIRKRTAGQCVMAEAFTPIKIST